MIKICYDFNMYRLKVLFIASRPGGTEVVNTYCLDYPDMSLDLALAEDLEVFMTDKYLRPLGINTESEQDTKALRCLRDSQAGVREELRHSDTAHIMYKNWYLEITEEYPLARFEKLFEPILYRNDRFLIECMGKAGIDLDDVTEIRLTGSECEYAFVRRHLEEMFGRECTYKNKTPNKTL